MMVVNTLLGNKSPTEDIPARMLLLTDVRWAGAQRVRLQATD